MAPWSQPPISPLAVHWSYCSFLTSHGQASAGKGILPGDACRPLCCYHTNEWRCNMGNHSVPHWTAGTPHSSWFKLTVTMMEQEHPKLKRDAAHNLNSLYELQFWSLVSPSLFSSGTVEPLSQPSHSPSQSYDLPVVHGQLFSSPVCSEYLCTVILVFISQSLQGTWYCCDHSWMVIRVKRNLAISVSWFSVHLSTKTQGHPLPWAIMSRKANLPCFSSSLVNLMDGDCS